MLDLNSWLLFIVATLGLAFAPGPGMLYVLSQTMSGGKSAGLASTLGASLGGIFHVFAAAFGISAILASSALAFSLVKYLGAAFLIYLGLKMLYSAYKGNSIKVQVSKERNVNFKSVFLQGVLAEALNPKTAIFFLAFIPQFVSVNQGGVFGQFVLLGMIVVVVNAIPDLMIVLFSKPVEKLWKNNARFRIIQEATSGVALMGLGVFLALSDSNKSVSTVSK
ncbi:MAG: LysE family translocator [Campylobacteraceae bacterium]|nr:LysE family translocator [Campylobacteraceae bacterium]